ncbi:transcriptional repressor TCF25-domain-containing protein [Astrocystis sublimbata]|nr:transcriptional repressor TCF25-domain-containing protein [Astrocystis sublimbata]
MSSRQLRKLQKQRELQQLELASPANADSDESEDDAPIPRAKPKPGAFSAFAALGGDDGDDDGDGDENDVNNSADEAAHTETSPQTTKSPDRAEPPTASSKKSKKKKKKKGNQSSTPATSKTQASKSDDIDEALRQLNLFNPKTDLSTGTPHDTARSKAYERICELLRINTYNLKVVNEMRNLFGREAIAAAMNEENEERARTQRPRHIPQQVDLETYLKGQPGKTLPEVTLRRNPFLPGKDTWPRAPTEGLSMTQLKEGTSAKHQPGTVEFGFAHDASYNMLEQEFFKFVQMYDPMLLVGFLHRHPYHISTLIQVSKIAKQDQNSALSADLCERALFTFGRVALSGFRQKLEEGKARLDFRRPENRQFWLAGYHYLKNLIMKGTYRTALEWAKLLLSMDLSDPYGMIHFIHPMAIRAHESKWFIDFCDSEILDEFDTVQDYIRQTLVLARLQQKDTAGAKALLLEGMERLPWLYSSLYKALNLDVPTSIWGLQPRDDHEELFVELYTHQTKSLWDNAQATGLLKEAAREAKKPNHQTFGFPPVVGRNVARFVYLDNTPSLMGHVPGDLLSTSPNWEFDPIPPSKDENIFSYDSQQQPWMPAERPETRGLEIPQDGEALRRLLARVRRGGDPLQIEAFIEQAIAETNRGDDGNAIDDDEDGENDAADGEADGEIRHRERRPGVLQAIMDIFHGRGADDDLGEEDDIDVYPDDHWGLAESEVERRMPGAWESDSDEDEVPDSAHDERPARGPAA